MKKKDYDISTKIFGVAAWTALLSGAIASLPAIGFLGLLGAQYVLPEKILNKTGLKMKDLP